ncbi:hypothetical protein AM571_CH02164 [Rhizobium etli 8C-3]|uniref:Uncharacterized protein n=2 Tax=Rhizobium TaxID=379 RepID=A0A4R3QAG0_9HYPH|nr:MULTISPECIES: hypothetical protein [Rhizobium]APO74973.1 hypothetical protein AM571_CH02164 [Rhizobium etli 8C-3]TCU17577.1 hypothetical protein EV130_11625 [Rhizobium azibense]TCU31660.1 hypothetical protein EV129_12525 [Rhizobium azibense]
MADIMKELVSGVVETVLREILKKTAVRNTTKRKKRKTRSSTTGRFTRTASAAIKPARKQVSKRRTATSRSRQRSR